MAILLLVTLHHLIFALFSFLSTQFSQHQLHQFQLCIQLDLVHSLFQLELIVLVDVLTFSIIFCLKGLWIWFALNRDIIYELMGNQLWKNDHFLCSQFICMFICQYPLLSSYFIQLYYLLQSSTLSSYPTLFITIGNLWGKRVCCNYLPLLFVKLSILQNFINFLLSLHHKNYPMITNPSIV